MNTRLQLMFGVMLLLAGSSLIANAQGFGDRNRPAGLGNYRIVGRVLNPDGTPAKDVQVSASSTNNGEASALTDVDGGYTISGLEAGNYTVTVHAKEYKQDFETITISEGTPPGQAFTASFYLRLPGQPKREGPPPNPFLEGVPKNAVAKYDKAMELMAKNDAKGAVPLFDEAIGMYPNFYLAYAEKGAAYRLLNDPDKAVEAFVKSISIKNDFMQAKYGYGQAMMDKKNYEVAAAVFNDILSQKSDFAEAHQFLGMSLFYIKNFDAAEKELKSASSTKGGEKLALPHLYLGLIYEQKKQNAGAITEFEKYLELAPKAGNADKVRSAIADLKKQA
jgi:Tfp pilus assembly protein PilF